MLITSEYLAEQVDLHKNIGYGTSAWQYADDVKKFNEKDILDYGCGKCTLQASLGFEITNYDPAIEMFKHNNEPHNLVFCGDVLEHIEPDCLDDVLADISRCTINNALLIISTIPAKKTLSDGRNAHLIIEQPEWWHDKVSEYFHIYKQEITKNQVTYWCKHGLW